MIQKKQIAPTLGSLFLSLALVLGNLASAVANAQQIADSEPPQIEHDVAAEGIAGAVQTFKATVWDDNSIQSVTLFYRFKGLEDYSQLVMYPGQKDGYEASVVTESGVETTIQYYIQAIDVAGLKVTSGLSFQPWERNLIVPADTSIAAEAEADPVDADPVSEEVIASTSANADSSAEAEPTVKKSKTIWYVLGGVALLGILAGLGGGDGGPPPNDCASTGCTVTFTLANP